MLDATQRLLDLGARIAEIKNGVNSETKETFLQWRHMKISIKEFCDNGRERYKLESEPVQPAIDFLYSDFLPKPAYDRLENLISNIASPGMLAAEVGCFTGRTAFCALPTIKAQGGLLYLIDWFRGCVDSKCVWTQDEFPRNRVASTLLNNLEAGDFLDIAIPMIGHSARSAAAFADRSLGYLYIGADHRYTQFGEDVDAWWPKLKLGGIMCGHGHDRRIVKDGPEWDRCLEHCETDCIDGVHWGISRLLAERFPDYGDDTGIWWVYKGIVSKGGET